MRMKYRNSTEKSSTTVRISERFFLATSLIWANVAVWAAVRNRSEAELTALAPNLPNLLGLSENTPPSHDATSHQVIQDFIQSEVWQQPPGSESLVPLGTTQDEFEAGDPAETEGDMETAANDAHGVRGLLYYIAEENEANKAYIHRGIRCEGCGDFPITGVRYHCLNCQDYDLCAACEAHAIHPKNHVFAKVKIPLSLLSQPPQPHKLWYAGDPRKIHSSLDVSLRKRVSSESGFNEAELDALYDQFTCIANVPWNEDPFRIAAAIDRRAFNKTMSSDRWSNRFAPNVLLDRMFAFYDTDGNSLIGFKEFVDGMEYLRGGNRFASLQRALEGFDMDGDTYVSRADFLRVLRGKFEIQKQLIIDSTEGLETERTQGAMNVLRSSQPISSVFNGEDIPPGEERSLHGKRLDENGDLEPSGNEKTILDDKDPFLESNTKAGPEQLGEALDRFEDLLHGTEPNDASHSMDGTVDLMSGLRVSLADAIPHTAETQPYVQDLLWHYKEDGLNALLDPLFARGEEVERRARATRDARKKWRADIDRVRSEQENPVDDTLAATAAEDQTERLLARGIVPTDRASLEQLEIETTTAPLEVLLEVSGYSIREEPQEPGSDVSNSSTQAATMDDARTAASSTSEEAGSVNPEPSRPVVPKTDTNKASTQPGDEGEQPPPVEILKLWARLDAVDRETSERGGTGRLSLAEVERIVVEEELHEVRGLIKSWLEWAAF